ncbi:MAG: hydroxymethylglutaryl-CoA reductase, degradative [Candidatus Thermoplasmatota archaeon]|nr:hydroxymethylglutaryl-CoA reductase, degradative [Candidatus Thermoplasmatota archaeon]MBU4255843.1 hydroxymethylglutaryl-CoA reductase, degradative [Candidatus Thermoplasmatota archaeon]
MKTSKISGFYKLSRKERLGFVKNFAGLTDEEIRILNESTIDFGIVDRMIENAVGVMSVPLGVAVNFLINGKDYLIPMAVEETSVIAAASNAAKIARVKGGFKTNSTEPVMIGQIQLVNHKNPEEAKKIILENKEKILEMANEKDPMLVKSGGGAKDINVRILDDGMVVTHLLVDVRDAMGANAVNTMCEAVAPFIEKITGGKVYLRILSNLAVHRLSRATAVFSKDIIGEAVVDGIMQAYLFAKSDPYRCATHNKGIMNGVDAVVIASGNDFRAVESGAHSYASMNGYSPLTKYEKNENGDLVGSIELPTPVGLIGGATKVHPTAKICVKILGVKTARELGEIIAAVGLAQNFAALKALASEGIQKGHMGLHARNIAIMAGAKDERIDRIAEQMIKEKKIRIDRAKEILKEAEGYSNN